MADEKKAAFGVFPQMRPRRSVQDPEAAKYFPVDLARGFTAGVLGVPGETELLGRLAANLQIPQNMRMPRNKEEALQLIGELFGADRVSLETKLPTTEEIEPRIPFGSDTPVSRAAAEAGGLAGSFYTGPLSAYRAAKAIPQAVKRAGKDFVQAAGQTVSPLTVYHGSPHKFEKFDPSKIGTGEGAQAYGHGLYFAESPGVAQSYKANLGTRKAEWDELTKQRQDVQTELDKYWQRDKNFNSKEASKLLRQQDKLNAQIKELEAGSLYTVDLPDEKIAQMLDWDKPLSQQNEVIKALKGTDYEVGVSQKEAEKIADQRLRQEADEWAEMSGGDPVDYINNADWEKYVDQVRKESGNVDSSITGADLHKMIMRDEGYRPDLFDPENYQIGTSEALRQLGVPGIKYLDRSSRQAGEGTRNFVVFPGEEEALTILERKKEGGKVRFTDNPDAMRQELQMAGGGAAKGMAKLIKRAAESAGQKAPVVAEKDLTTLQDFHTSLGDRIRQGAADMQNLVESTPFKYDKGQRVFTEDSARKNKPPYEILRRTMVGNQPMRADHPQLGPGMGKVIKDPETGQTMRTPYEPGYIVRSELDDGVYEFQIPESAIKGDVGMARGGKVRFTDNPDTMRLELSIGGALGRGAKAAKAAKAAEKAPAVPLDIPRVRPTKEVIQAAAERVGRQQLGEHVTSPLTGTKNLAGRSMKESERVKNLQYDIQPIKEIPKAEPYQPKVGEVNIALPGDQTVSDMILKSVEDTPIGSTQQGGALFGQGRLTDPEEIRAFWASNVGASQAFQNKVTALAQMFDTDLVTAYHLAMGMRANNFAQHFADANIRAIDYSKLSKNAMDIFDSHIAAGFKNPQTGEMMTFPDWPGIANPEQALEAMKNNSELRKWFNNRMKTPALTQPLNLPDGRSIEYAITEPDIRNMEINLTGLSAGRMKPGAELMPETRHQTYSHGIPGTAIGKAPELAPFEISFPDVTSFVREKYRPQDFTGTIQKVFPHQIVDEAYLDDMQRYYDHLRRVRGYAEGGPVDPNEGGVLDMNDGGNITADDLSIEERPL